MASLQHEYFVRDAKDLTTYQSWTINRREDGSVIGEIIARLHFDFDANAKHISFYIPALDEVACPETLALERLPEILKRAGNASWHHKGVLEANISREVVWFLQVACTFIQNAQFQTH